MRNSRTSRPALAVTILALAFACVSCSTAPKAPDAVFAVKNKAAELAKLGDAFMIKALYEKALQYYGESLSASQEVDDIEGASGVYAAMGRAYVSSGDSAQAERQFLNALDYARMSGSSAARSMAKAGLGEVAFSKGDKAGALALFEEAAALASAKDVKDDKSLAVALHDRGVAKAALSREAEALADFTKAESMNLKAKRWTELGTNRYAIASTLASTGKTAEAMTAVLGALDADKRGENSRAIPLDLAAAASLSVKLGKDADAWDYWRRSLDASLANNDPASTRKALIALIALAPKLAKAEDGKAYQAMIAQLDAAQAQEKPVAPQATPAPGAQAKP
jgi:tetratricopeptide (TPR) repeat protein